MNSASRAFVCELLPDKSGEDGSGQGAQVWSQLMCECVEPLALFPSLLLSLSLPLPLTLSLSLSLSLSRARALSITLSLFLHLLLHLHACIFHMTCLRGSARVHHTHTHTHTHTTHTHVRAYTNT